MDKSKARAEVRFARWSSSRRGRRILSLISTGIAAIVAFSSGGDWRSVVMVGLGVYLVLTEIHEWLAAYEEKRQPEIDRAIARRHRISLGFHGRSRLISESHGAWMQSPPIEIVNHSTRIPALLRFTMRLRCGEFPVQSFLDLNDQNRTHTRGTWEVPPSGSSRILIRFARLPEGKLDEELALGATIELSDERRPSSDKRFIQGDSGDFDFPGETDAELP